MMNNNFRKRGIGQLLATEPKTAVLDNLVELSADRIPGGICVVSPALQNIDLREWLGANLGLVNGKLTQYGALLFRGFDLKTTESFGQVTGALFGEAMEYKYRSSPRTELASKIYTSTDYPSSQYINMHNELSYAASWPLKIAFFCLRPASKGGETPIADSRKVLGYLSDDTKAEFARKGLRYVRKLSRHLGLPWNEVFQTDDQTEVENVCKCDNMEYTWLGTEQLNLSWTKPAIVNHPIINENIWFNHGYFFNALSLGSFVPADLKEQLPFNTSYGDGSPIGEKALEEIKAAYEKATVTFSWEKGDLLLLDNMLMAHGRYPFEGDRKIAVAMGDPYPRQ